MDAVVSLPGPERPPAGLERRRYWRSQYAKRDRPLVPRGPAPSMRRRQGTGV